MSRHVTLVFEGRAYTRAEPVLRYPAMVLAQAGADVRTVPYPALDDTALQSLGEPEQWRAFDTTVAASVAELAAGATAVTLLGKSLGTRAMAMLDAARLPADTNAIWLTPLFGVPEVVERASTKSWRSLYVFGTADPSHDPDGQAAVAAATGGTQLAIEDGNHALEIPGDALASAEAIVTLTRAVESFVRSRA